MSLGKAIGSPIGVDKHTLQRDFGYFASVLVDIDLSKPVPNQILVKKEEGKTFFQEVELVKMPKFCRHYKLVGHFVTEFNWADLVDENDDVDDDGDDGDDEAGTHTGLFHMVDDDRQTEWLELIAKNVCNTVLLKSQTKPSKKAQFDAKMAKRQLSYY
ncbi:hypothetical protein IFM89_021460 [Coptis chinensis]|uniref:Uncharacterized protein n=1 Tax=Coptis chinensis TaxID=261450 RepID=A0A835INX9_9MAGN|nr:hypothetical protein IFM89_021460 [Coptis chinensis]